MVQPFSKWDRRGGHVPEEHLCPHQPLNQGSKICLIQRWALKFIHNLFQFNQALLGIYNITVPKYKPIERIQMSLSCEMELRRDLFGFEADEMAKLPYYYYY